MQQATRSGRNPIEQTYTTVNGFALRAQARLSAGRYGRVVLFWWPYVVLTTVAIVYISAAVVHHGPVMSVYDEGTYLDVLVSMPENAIAQQGEPYSLKGRELFSCVGVMYYGTTGAPCVGDYSDQSLYPQQGVTSANSYTPLFFWVSFLVAEFLTLFGIWFVDGARISMLVWLIPTVLFTFATMRCMRVRTPMALPVCLLFIASPFSWWTFTFVSTDAPAVFIGAISIWVGILFLLRRASLWWLVPIAALGQALKVTTFLAPVLVGLICLCVWGARRFRNADASLHRHVAAGVPIPFHTWFWPVVVSGIALVAVRVGWDRFQHAIAIGEAPDQALQVHLGMPGEMMYQVTAFLSSTVVSHPFRYVGISSYTTATLFSTALSILVAAGILAAFFKHPRSTTESGFSLAVVIASLTFAPALFVVVGVLAEPFAMPARYGAALLPAFFVALAITPERRLANFAVATVAWLGSAYVFLALPSFA